MRPVLIVGVPRSGTTWVGRVLSRTDGAVSVHEPDNEKTDVFALWAKRGLGRYPALAPGEISEPYARLWDRAFDRVAAPDSASSRLTKRLFDGASPSQRERALEKSGGARLRTATLLASRWDRTAPIGARPVVKSVHAALALEWLAARRDLDVLVVLRDPRNVIASWLEMKMPDADRELERDERVRRLVLQPLGITAPGNMASPLSRAAWQLGVLTSSLKAAIARHPEWVAVTHEELCADPVGRFRETSRRLGLTWTDSCVRFLERADQPGDGYQVRRVAADQADRWRQRLTSDQVEEITGVLSSLPAGASLLTQTKGDVK